MLDAKDMQVNHKLYTNSGYSTFCFQLQFSVFPFFLIHQFYFLMSIMSSIHVPSYHSVQQTSGQTLNPSQSMHNVSTLTEERVCDVNAKNSMCDLSCLLTWCSMHTP